MVRISACVITKNEEKHITRWLENMRPVADEILVIDTGSEDATVSLAQQGGAQVYQFPWQDDFSAAKNFAIEQAHGEWILFLDADEYFSPDSILKVRPLIERYQANRKIVAFISQWINLDEDEHDRFIKAEYQVRIFRNQTDLRYAGKIHETLQSSSLRNGYRQMRMVPELVIYHTGYSSSLVREKLIRNLHFLQQKTAAAGEDPMDAVYFMDCYFGLGEYAKAAAYAQQALQNGSGGQEMASDVYSTLTASLEQLQRPVEELFSVLDEAGKKMPDIAEFPLQRALFCWKSQDFVGAEKYARQGIALYERAKQSGAVLLADNAQRFLPYVYLHLGEWMEMQRNRSAARENYWQGLMLYPYAEELFLHLYRCLEDWEATDIIQLLNLLYDRHKDAAFLLRLLTPSRAGKVYLYYAHQAGLAANTTEAYLAAGEFAAAAMTAGNILDGAYTLGIGSSLQQNDREKMSTLHILLPDAYKDKHSRMYAAARRIFGQEYAGASDAQNPVNSHTQVAAAAALFAAGDRVSAIRQLLEIWQQQPKCPELTYGLAYLLYLDGQLEEARRVLLATSVATEAMRSLWQDLHADANYPFVSILIPTYNRPRLFELTLRSAMAQTYTNVEIIVCDNSTNEQTADLMREKHYQENLRVRYVRNREAHSKAENFQPFERLAKGEMLQWLMDDDILVREKLAKMVRCLQQHPQVRLVTSRRGMIDLEGKVFPRDQWPQTPFEDMAAAYGIYDGQAVGRRMLVTANNFLGEPSAVLFWRRDLQHHYWQADCRGYQALSDVAMWLELLETGDVAVFRDPLSYFRRHSGQEGQQPDVIVQSRLEWYQLMEDYRARGLFLQADEYRKALEQLQQDRMMIQEGLHAGASSMMWEKYMALGRMIDSILHTME